MIKSDMQKLKALSAELIPTSGSARTRKRSIVLELRRQLKLQKMVKVKMLKAALFESSREEIAHELEHTRCTIVDLKGATAVYLSPYRIKKRLKTTSRIRERI